MNRSHETVIDIKATPEQVFRAISDPEWIVKWFAPEVRVDPRVGGEYYISWGPGMGGTSIISVYEPNKRFAGYTDRSIAYGSEGKPVETGVVQRLAVDHFIEALGDGMTRLRLVQSGFGEGAAWDGEFESSKAGWEMFLKKLKELLEN
ncbi:MAG TPA: SRPBCC domain-containing protein [Bryobacteraceae bacterium]|nr:SRPBCC domain-containing protein [Bryobacteraceae bacterium]